MPPFYQPLKICKYNSLSKEDQNQKYTGLNQTQPPLLSAQRIISSIYLHEYEEKGCVDHFRETAMELAIQRGGEQGLVDSLLYTMHSQFQDEEYLAVISKDIRKLLEDRNSNISLLVLEIQELNKGISGE